MRKAEKKLLCLALALLLCIGLFPLSAAHALASGDAAEAETELPAVEEALTKEEPEADAAVPENIGEDPVIEEETEEPPVPETDTAVPENIEEDAVVEEEAEELPVIEETVEEEVSDRTRITGFADPGIRQLTEKRKPALCEVLKQLPEELGVYVGGMPSADPAAAPEGAELRTVPVTWSCVQDYDEWLTDYDFIPAAEGLRVAEGVQLPTVRLTVEDLSTPAGGHVLSGMLDEVPPVGSSGLRRSAGSYYNGYELGLMPPVRDQSPYGTCWSFAAIGAVEIDLISDGRADPNSIDLSELHLAYFSYHSYTDPKGLNAGDTVYAADYLTRGGNSGYACRTLINMVGPVDETDAPYDSAASYAPDGTAAKSLNAAQVTGFTLINPEDREAVKAAILQHGSIDISMYQSSYYYSGTNNSYYCPVSQEPTHDVLLVGWDDSFPAENFLRAKPEGDGAWLVRNSWGYDGYGSGGYFWISYYDASIFRDVFCAFDATMPLYDHVCISDPVDDTVLYEHIYAADTAVKRCGWNYNLAENTKVTQHCLADAGETVEAVGMEIDAGSVFTVTVSDGSRSAFGSCASDFRGYCLTKLDRPFYVAEPTDLTVTVTSLTGGKLFFEQPGTDSTGIFTASCGSGGFVMEKPNGSRQEVKGDASIKLYTSDRPDPLAEYVRRCYRLILNREADEKGLAYWVAGLRSGERKGADIVSLFMNSEEYTHAGHSHQEDVTTLYRVMLNRAPDAEGLAYWVGLLDQGCSCNGIINGFSTSDEFARICGDYGIEPGTVPLEWRDKNPKVTAFVSRNYQYALLRSGDADGLNYWCEQLITERQTPKQCAANFVFSEECVARGLNNRQFVEMLYPLYMDREADLEGLNYWTNQLNSLLMTRRQVSDCFADSPEFQQIIAAYGL